MIQYLQASIVVLVGLMLFGNTSYGQFHIDIDKPPFNYQDTEANNRVSRLIAKLDSKEVEMAYTRERGYLKSLLEALEIPESSQALVFSKTSMQVRHISRSNPRAIFFNDDTYVGWINGSPLIEISTADPKLGAAFYTFEMSPHKVSIKRAGHQCLGCHATSMTQGVPGHVVRSVFPTYDGSIRVQKESFVTDHSSPFSKRWGGWYVTGLHGDMEHMGNTFLRGEQLDTSNKGNRTDLREEFNTTRYLSPYSDIVALMVLEHQSQMHNTLTRADFSMRQLIHERSKLPSNLEGEEVPDKEEQLLIQSLAKTVVDSLLFSSEFKLTSEVIGLEDFAKQFAIRGPRDSQGRSLREFDLKTRIFKYPCSFLIHSDAFNSLDPTLRGEILSQLLKVLVGENQSNEYKHLGQSIRRDILSILVETKPDLPESWKTAHSSR